MGLSVSVNSGIFAYTHIFASTSLFFVLQQDGDFNETQVSNHYFEYTRNGYVED